VYRRRRLFADVINSDQVDRTHLRQ